MLVYVEKNLEGSNNNNKFSEYFRGVRQHLKYRNFYFLLENDIFKATSYRSLKNQVFASSVNSLTYLPSRGSVYIPSF